MDEARNDGLQIDEDLAFQHHTWVAQRVAWVLLALIILGAAAGLLGSGPLSHTRAALPGLMTVEYQRFARLETAETLTVRLEPAATAGSAVRLSLSRDFVESAMIRSVLPPPLRVESAAGRLVYVFAVAERSTPMVVRFNLEPQEIGIRRGVVALESAPEPRPVVFRQLVYP